MEIDILRQYVVLFGWIKGSDAVETAEQFGLEGGARAEFLARVTSLVTHELWQKGYRVVDMKPQHIILRPRPDKSLLRDHNDQYRLRAGGLRTARTDAANTSSAVRSANRQLYLKHMARRFDADAAKPLPAHLQRHERPGRGLHFWPRRKHRRPALGRRQGPRPVHLFPARNAGGARRRKNFPRATRFYYTRTKDNINLVWKVSRMGELPHLSQPGARNDAARDCGFNSPFEEFAFALEMGRRGVRTVYPRAIYMTGHRRDSDRQISDERRYAALADLRTPDGEPVVRREYDYITIWGFWNGPDELLAAQDGKFYRAVNVKRAFADKLISHQTMDGIDAADVAAAGRLRL